MAGIVALSLLAVAPLFADGPASPVTAPPAPPAPTTDANVQTAVFFGVGIAATGVLLLLWWRNVIRPGAIRKSRRNVNGLPALLWLGGAAILFIAPAFGAGLAMGLPEHVLGAAKSVRHDGIVALAGYLLAIATAGLLIYLVLPRAKGAGLEFRWKDLGAGFLAFSLALPVVLAVGFLATAASQAITGKPPETIAHATLDQIRQQRDNPWVYAVIAAAVLGAPIIEELTYRVFLQSALARALVDRLAAVLLTSTLFALVHRLGASPVPWHAIAPIFALGLAAGIAYERTARPMVPIVMHAAFNATNVALALILT